jgi:hypothetical protein
MAKSITLELESAHLFIRRADLLALSAPTADPSAQLADP